MNYFAAIIVFLIVISFHEAGHFFAAKSVGIRVNEFSIGMGPAIWQKTKGETLYSLRIIPLGGYCAMEGEEEDSDEVGAFKNALPWQRFITVIAGAVMNLIIAWIAFSLFLIISGRSAGVFSGLIDGFKLLWQTFFSLFQILGQLFTGQISLDALSGPVGVVKIIGEAASQGFSVLLFLTAYISTNLGFFNLLPIPALDGFTLLLIIIEKIRGKALKTKTEERIKIAGFVLLMALILFVSVKDVIRLF